MSEKEEIKTDYKITHEGEVDHEEFIKILNEETLDIDWKATAKENIKSIFELEEKLKKLKKANQELQDYIIEDLAPHANMYRKELEELKEKNKKLNKEWKEWRDLADALARITEQRNKYKSFLEEINNITEKLCICNNGINGACRPIKGTTRNECLNALYDIKNLLEEVLRNGKEN